jgi:hypothetical protein
MRKIFGPTWQEVTGDYKMRSFIKKFLAKYHSGVKKNHEWDGRGM